MSRDDVESSGDDGSDAPVPMGPSVTSGAPNPGLRRSPGDPDPEDEPGGETPDDGRELDEQIAMYLRLGLPAGTVLCAIVGGVLQGAAAVVLVLAAGALVSVIAIFWASVRTLVGETPLSGADAYALGAPRAEEEQKRAVLRALKDLEFEHSVGKISEEDYQALVARYRGEAKRLLRMIDEEAQPGRQKVEDLVAERLYREGLAEAPPNPYRGADPQTKPARKKKGKPAKAAPQPGPLTPPLASPVVEGADARPACASCGTRNDPDAVFCKKCGARQGGEQDDATADPPPGEKKEAS